MPTIDSSAAPFFAVGEEHAEILRQVVRFAEDRHHPHGQRMDDEEGWPSEVHGGAGYIWETEINRLYRAEKLMQIGAGTTEVRRSIVARELLGV